MSDKLNIDIEDFQKKIELFINKGLESSNNLSISQRKQIIESVLNELVETVITKAIEKDRDSFDKSEVLEYKSNIKNLIQQYCKDKFKGIL